MGTFPSLSRSERAPDKITTAAVRAQDQFLGTVDAVTSPDSPTPSRGLIAKGRDRPPRRLIGGTGSMLAARRKAHHRAALGLVSVKLAMNQELRFLKPN